MPIQLGARRATQVATELLAAHAQNVLVAGTLLGQAFQRGQQLPFCYPLELAGQERDDAAAHGGRRLKPR